MSNYDEQIKDRKEMREKFKQKLDEYKVSEDDKKELLTLSTHMDSSD